MSKILNLLLAAAMLVLCIFIATAESLEFPSLYGSAASIIAPPVTYLIAILPLVFGISIVLSIINRDRYMKHCQIIISAGVLIFFVALVIVAPMLDQR